MAGVLVAASMLLASMDGSDLDQLAASAGVDPADLQAAAVTVGVDPYTYLVGEGLVGAQPSKPQLVPAVERRLDCIGWYESRHTASATNPRSRAAGEYQFLWSTWASTPQGRAGLSPYDPIASREAARWMLSVGRAREWVPVQLGWC